MDDVCGKQQAYAFQICARRVQRLELAKAYIRLKVEEYSDGDVVSDRLLTETDALYNERTD